MLTNTLFTHVHDKDWIKLREDYWQEWCEPDLKSYHGYTKKQIQVMKAYYESGNIEALFSNLKRMKEPLEVYEVLALSPFKCKEEFDYIVGYYCEYYLPEHLESGAISLEHTQNYIQKYLASQLSGGDQSGLGNPFALEMSDIIFGEHFKPEVIYPISFPHLGQPVIALNLNTHIGGVMPKIRGYLFDKKRRTTNPISNTTVNYFLSLLPLVDVYPFSLKLIENKKSREERDYTPHKNQYLFRSFFANLYGYMHDANDENVFGFFAPELQADIKAKIENMNLGPEFDALIEMIHRHKGEVLYISEENDKESKVRA